MNLKRNIIKVFSANLLSLVTGIIIGFIVPAILSIESYSQLKMYSFYISYVTCLHFGFIDGMYVKYGGIEIDNINKEDLKREHIILLLIEIIISSSVLIIAVLKKDLILFLFSLSIIPINMSSFHKQLFQATGQFDKFSKISYLYNITYFTLNVVMVWIYKCTSFIPYSLIILGSNILVYIILELKFIKSTAKIKFKYDKSVWKNIKIGIYILLGNFAVMFFFTIDRWFVKIFYDLNDFAYYSFAVSMLNIINTLITGISVVFYNYLCTNVNKEKIIKFKSYLIIIGAFATSGYFVLAGIVNIFIDKYIPSLSIISISFAAYPFIIVINSLYINLYKKYDDKKQYLRVVITMIIISCIYNIVFIKLLHKFESIALATTMAFITWYIYSSKDFEDLKITINEVIYLFSTTTLFLLITKFVKRWFVAGGIFLAILIVLTNILYKNEIKYLFLNAFRKRDYLV